jgi:gluconokinase
VGGAASARVATRTVVVMGASGSGKSTVARLLADRTGWPMCEADDLHPAANVAKMAAGIPLVDDDRWPWLKGVAGWIGEQEAAGRDAVVACSALRRAYRDVLRDGHPSVVFVYLQLSEADLNARVAGRRGHFMPAALVASQLATLEPLAADEPGLALDGAARPDVLVDQVVSRLLQG